MKMTVKQLKSVVTEAANASRAEAAAKEIVDFAFGPDEERSISYQVHGSSIELDHYDLGKHWIGGDTFPAGVTSKQVAAYLDARGARRKKRKKLVRNYPTYD